MRFEAKHSYFEKNLTQNNGNFIDLLFTLSLRHQKLRCCHNLDRFGYHSHTLDIGRGEVVSSVVVPPELTNCSKEILRAVSVSIDSTLYKKPCALVIKMGIDFPIFGKLPNILFVVDYKGVYF